MSQSSIASYEAGLREYVNSDSFSSLDRENLGVGINAFKTQFLAANPGSFDESDSSSINTINQSILTEYKNKAEIPRFIPKAEEWDTYYEPRPDFSIAKDADAKIKMSKDWEEASLKKAAYLRPADTEDFKTHLEYITNNDIRQSVFDAKKRKGGVMAWMDDKTNRAVEGALSMVTPFIDGSDRWLAESFPEDPSTSGDMTSLLFSGAGQLVAQAGIAIAASAAAGPQAGVAAIGTIYSARALVEGYNEEMRKSGNADKALDVGIAGIPGALLETMADSMLFGMGKSGKVYLDAFRRAATELEKRAVLKAAFPSMGKQALKNGIAEGTIGSIGADWTTGYGRYLASGDDSYIPSGESLIKGALVEGILGAGYSSLNSMAFDSSRTEAFAKDLADKNKAKADDIFNALRSGNYQEAVNLATKDYSKPEVVDAPPTQEVKQQVNVPGVADASKNISLSQIGSTNIAYLEQQRSKAEKSGDTESAKRIAENLSAIRDGSFVNPSEYNIDPERLKENGFEDVIDPIGSESSYDVKLENNQQIQSDGYTVFISGLDNKSAVTHSIAKGGVGILISDGGASLVFGKELKQGNSKLKFSQTPLKGYSAISVRGAFANESGQTVITGFSILGKVQESKKSKESQNKPQQIREKFAEKDSSDENYSDDFDNSGINEAMSIIDTVNQNESFSDAGFASIEKSIDSTIDSLDSYASKNTSEKDAVLDLQNELLNALDEARSKTKPVDPVRPVRANVNLFQDKIEQAANEQMELGIPIKVSDLAGKTVTFEGNTGVLTIDGPLAYVGNVQVSGSQALISDVQGLSEYAPKNTEYTLGPDESGRMYKSETISGKLARVYQNGEIFYVSANKNTNISTKLKEKKDKIKKAVRDRKQIVETVKKEEPVVTIGKVTGNIALDKSDDIISDLSRINRDTVKSTNPEWMGEQETVYNSTLRLQWLFNNGYIEKINGQLLGEYRDRSIVLFKVGNLRIPFYLSTGMGGKNGVPKNKWYPFFGFGKSGGKFWIAKTNDGEIASYYNFPAFQKIAKILDEGVGITSSVDLVSDLNPEEFNKSINLTPFDINAKRIDVVASIMNNLNLINNEILRLQGKEPQTVELPKQPTPSNITSDLDAVFESVAPSGVTVETSVFPSEDPIISEEEKAVLAQIAYLEEQLGKSVEERWGKKSDTKINEDLTVAKAKVSIVEKTGEADVASAVQKDQVVAAGIIYTPEVNPSEEPSNKVISDKVDEYISGLQNQKAKDKWTSLREQIIDFASKTIANPSDNFRGDFSGLGSIILDRVEADIVSKLDDDAKKQIEKDRSANIGVSAWEKNYLRKVESENADLKKVAKENKIRFSIGSEPSGKSVPVNEALDYIYKNHPNIRIVSTSKTTSDGHQWRGMTDFTGGSPRISINIANIRDIAQLKNVIHEELAHIAFNDPEISSSLAKIVESTKLREDLNGIYKPGDVFEESVVKRMADLVDSYTEKGTLGKLITAIKSYVKDKLGMTLSDNDLSYIAYRAIVRASKVTSGQGQTKFAYDPQSFYIKSITRSLKNVESLLADNLGIKISLLDRPIPKMRYTSTSLNPLKDAYPEIADLIELGYLNKQSNSMIAKVTNSTGAEIAGLEESTITDPLKLDLMESFKNDAIIGEKKRLAIIKSLEEKTKGLYDEQELLEIADDVYDGINSAYFANSNIKYNKVDPNKNTSTASTLFEPEDDILSIVTGQISEDKKRTLRNIQRAIRKKLEKDLIIDEPQAWNALKAIKFTFLNNEQLKSFNSLLDEFVRTRSNGRDPGDGVRKSTEQVIAEASDLVKASNQGHFEFLQLQHDFLEGKDFEMDFQGDIDLVNQLAKDNRGTNDSDLPRDKDGESLQNWQLRVLDLQDTAFENKDYIQDLFNDMFPSASNSTSNQIISEGIGIYVDSVNDVMAGHKEVFKQRINELMSDPTSKSFRDLRKQYYGLMDFIADGYALNIEDFITEETKAILSTVTQDSDFLNTTKIPLRKMNAGAASLYANTRALGNKMQELTHNLTSSFRAGILAAERIQSDFIEPTLKKFMDKAVALNGGKSFDGEQLNLAGIYGMARTFKATEGVTKGVLASKASIQRSINKDINSIQPNRKKTAEIHSKFISDLFVGIDENTPNDQALGIIEKNAEAILPPGIIGYVKDVVELFEVTKPLSKFTTEFALGRPFDEWVNYIPALAINKDGSPIDVDVLDLNSTSDDVALSDINKDTNMSRSGGSSTKDRTRQLGNSKVYVFNINHIASNRMRLNLIDYLTLPQRRELNNVISGTGTVHKEFANLLKDTDGPQERVSHMQKTIRTAWSNTVQSASFISEFQAGVNWFSNLWASSKLASIYQLPGQFASNLAPYFIVNAGSPKRIKYLFDAFSILLKKQMGQQLDPRLDKVVTRVLSTIRSRSQDQHLDKSIALDRNSGQMWEQVKSSKMWDSLKDINGIREKIMFAPFKFSDYLSGAPMMLANIMHYEEVAGRATGWDGLTFNDNTFIRSLDETERFIGIGASSRRGVWTNNKNGWLVVVRNMLSSFSSHRINNATNAAIEIAKIRDSNITSSEKGEAFKYLMGIYAQSAMFSVVKWGMVGAFYNLLTSKMGEEENEDELEKAYRKALTGTLDKGQKKMLEAEIAMRQNIRNELARARENNNAKDIVVLRGLQDMVANTFLIPSVSDIPLNIFVHATYDKIEAEHFTNVKNQTISDLEGQLKKAKASKNTNLAIELQKDISRWNAQEAIPLVYERKSIVPTDGLYGGVLNDAYKFLDSAAGAALTTESLTMSDVFAGAGLIGLSQPDLNRWARLYSKIDEYEAEYVEKLKEIQAKRLKKDD